MLYGIQCNAFQTLPDVTIVVAMMVEVHVITADENITIYTAIVYALTEQ